jgi:ParB family transcriptional regulator, chromosome partitioning protein
VSSRRGLPEARKMRHDRHFVDELTSNAVTGVGQMIPVDQIETNREQPRTAIGDLADLAASIRRHGVLEPLLVRRLPEVQGKFQLIAGERRFHAAIEAGLVEVPCIEMTVTDQQALELALIENLQRKDLTPFEEADGFRSLVEKYGYSHEDVAAAVGRSRTSVSESLKLLDIPPGIRDLCRHADITAKTLLLLVARARSIEDMEMLVQEIAEKSLDREAARFLSRQARDDNSAADAGAGADSSNAGRAEPAAHAAAFRPIRFRFRPSNDAPVHLSLSIRRPGVSREEVIQTLEVLLGQLRAGALDQHLQPQQAECPAPSPDEG